MAPEPRLRAEQSMGCPRELVPAPVLQRSGKTLVGGGWAQEGQGYDIGQVAKSRALGVGRAGRQKKRREEFSSPGTCPLLEISMLSSTSPSRGCAGTGAHSQQPQ